MPIDAAIVGTRLPESHRAVSVRDVLAYSAGIGDTSSAVFDDLGELAAPPPYCVSLEWPVVSDPEKRKEYRASDEELQRGVHAHQDSLFHRTIRPGDDLVTRGVVASVRESRAGAIVVCRVDTEERSSGEPVVTSWTTSIFRGVAVDGSVETAAQPPAPPETTTDVDATKTVWIAPELPHVYTECARIWNPIHTERSVARAAGLPDIILHGTATWALAAREILHAHADGQPARLERFSGRFTAMVPPGTEIRVEHARRGDVVSFTVRNVAGEAAISEGFAILR
ncbi:MAG: MaoC/PaaZ C-terminal domain-containing protein [Acidobacteriota bacterium]